MDRKTLYYVVAPLVVAVLVGAFSFGNKMIDYYCSPGSLFLGFNLSGSVYCPAVVYLAHVVILSVILIVLIFVFVPKSQQHPSDVPPQTNTAERDGIAMQGVSKSPVNSYNTITTQIGAAPPPGYEIPTRQQLKHQIGVDIQRFYKQFESIERQHDEDLEYYYALAMKQLEQIRDRHSPHANLILQDTLVPRALDKLYGEMKRYRLYLLHWRNGRQEWQYYRRNDANVPEYVDTNIEEAADQMRSAKHNIFQLVGEIVDASRENKP